mmetsp:Transcript_17810/g.51999  ORF Transcript_17810/g.51999 Transcript_17810/m.51999 type:complete len:381 (-) Transcript_17810:14-1156(-)
MEQFPWEEHFHGVKNISGDGRRQFEVVETNHGLREVRESTPVRHVAQCRQHNLRVAIVPQQNIALHKLHVSVRQANKRTEVHHHFMGLGPQESPRPETSIPLASVVHLVRAHGPAHEPAEQVVRHTQVGIQYGTPVAPGDGHVVLHAPDMPVAGLAPPCPSRRQHMRPAHCLWQLCTRFHLLACGEEQPRVAGRKGHMLVMRLGNYVVFDRWVGHKVQEAHRADTQLRRKRCIQALGLEHSREGLGAVRQEIRVIDNQYVIAGTRGQATVAWRPAKAPEEPGEALHHHGIHHMGAEHDQVHGLRLLTALHRPNRDQHPCSADRAHQRSVLLPMDTHNTDASAQSKHQPSRHQPTHRTPDQRHGWGTVEPAPLATSLTHGS